MLREDIEARIIFLGTLEWLMALTVRYASPVKFGLVYIAYGNKNELGETYGAQEAAKQLAAVTVSLKNAFRKADLVTRNGSDFWVIVPYTPDTEKLYDKVVEILDVAEHEGLQVVNRETSIFNLTDNIAQLDKQFKSLDALGLLDFLKENKETFAEHLNVSKHPS
jgi:GGDEF domain-containing protein